MVTGQAGSKPLQAQPGRSLGGGWVGGAAEGTGYVAAPGAQADHTQTRTGGETPRGLSWLQATCV